MFAGLPIACRSECKSPDAFCTFFNTHVDALVKARAKEGARFATAMNEAQWGLMKDWLRGFCGAVQNISRMCGDVERSLTMHLTEEQLRLSRFVGPRVAVQGYAGTGKTLMAIDHARRKAADSKSFTLLVFHSKTCLEAMKNDFRDVFSKKNVTAIAVQDFCAKQAANSFDHLILDEMQSYRDHLEEVMTALKLETFTTIRLFFDDNQLHRRSKLRFDM